MASPEALLGTGLYETMRVSEGAALHGERHLERLTASAHALGLPVPARSSFAGAIAAASGAGEVVRVRLHDAGGDPELRAERRLAAAPEPVRLKTLRGWYAPGYVLREHKLTSHFHGVQGRRLAQAAGYDDALLVAHDGRVGEGTNSNVALLVADVLVSPPVDGLLPGVCRAVLLEVAGALGLPVEERPVELDELAGAGHPARRPRRAVSARPSPWMAEKLPGAAPELLALLRDAVAAAARARALALP